MDVGALDAAAMGVSKRREKLMVFYERAFGRPACMPIIFVIGGVAPGFVAQAGSTTFGHSGDPFF